MSASEKKSHGHGEEKHGHEEDGEHSHGHHGHEMSWLKKVGIVILVLFGLNFGQKLWKYYTDPGQPIYVMAMSGATIAYPGDLIKVKEYRTGEKVGIPGGYYLLKKVRYSDGDSDHPGMQCKIWLDFPIPDPYRINYTYAFPGNCLDGEGINTFEVLGQGTEEFRKTMEFLVRSESTTPVP